MLATYELIQTILSNRAETKRNISWARMERSAYKARRVPSYYRLGKDTDIVPNMQKEAFFCCSILPSAEAVKWKNEGYAGLKEQVQKGRPEDSAMRDLRNSIWGC